MLTLYSEEKSKMANERTFSKYSKYDNVVWVNDQLGVEYTTEVYTDEKHIILESDESGQNQQHRLAFRFNRKTGDYIGKVIV